VTPLAEGWRPGRRQVVVLLPPIRQVVDRVQHSVGSNFRLEIAVTKFARANENATHARALCTLDIANDVVADHHDFVGAAMEAFHRGLEERSGRLAEHDGTGSRRTFERCDEGRDV